VPGRLNLSGDEMAERVREQTRVRVRRHRAGGNATPSDGNATPPHKKEARNVTPSQTLPYGEPALVDRVRGVGAILAPFEARGYKHNPVFWAKMAAAYPGLDLELEALKMADWLEEPKNARRRCIKGFLENWLKKSEADRVNAAAAPPPRAMNGSGPYHPPAAFQRNLLKTYKAPEDFSPDELARSDAARERVKELLPANLRARWHR
jgi:hypothetical protein